MPLSPQEFESLHFHLHYNLVCLGVFKVIKSMLVVFVFLGRGEVDATLNDGCGSI